jgi:nucleotide-binding universal stress UspA family protein
MKRVIVAIDESEYSVTAARTAVDLARSGCINELCFVHVVSLKPGQLGTDAYPERPDLPETWPVFQEPLAIAREAGIPVRCEVLFGNTSDMILRHAREKQADLIVVGSLGQSGIKESLLGNVATRVTAHAPCSVLVVRPGFRLGLNPEETA